MRHALLALLLSVSALTHAQEPPRPFVPNFPLPKDGEKLPLTHEARTHATEQWRLGNYEVALTYFAQAYAEDRAAGNIAGMAADLNQIGLVQWRLDDCSSALECYEESARLAEQCGDLRLLGLTSLNRAIILKNQGDLHGATLRNREAMRVLGRNGTPKDVALAFNNQGQIHKNAGQADSAVHYYERSLVLSDSLGDAEGMATACFNLSGMKAREGRMAEAFTLAWSSLALARTVKSKVRINEALLQLSELHEQQGTMDSALAYFKVHRTYIDSLNAADRAEALAAVQARMGLEVKDLRIRALQSEQALRRTRTIVAVTALAVVLVLGAFLVRRRLIRMRRRGRVLEAELDSARSVLVQKEHELKAHILEVAEKTLRIQDLQQELAQRTPTAVPHDMEVAELLEQRILTDADWRSFKEKFTAIYPQFFARIKLLGINLTEGEVRSMVLLRLGLAPKEMADVLGISPQSARVGKMRLKKKLLTAGHASIEELLERLIA